MKSGYWTREFIAGLFHLITPYWNSEEKKSARLYLAGIITLTIAAVYMTLLLNEWFNSFYSALQNYDSGAVYRGLLRFTGLAFAHIAFAVYSYYLQQRLALRWRKWMTKNYLAKWTGRQMYYRLIGSFVVHRRRTGNSYLRLPCLDGARLLRSRHMDHP